METIKSIWFEGGRIYMRSENGSLYSRPLEAFPRLLEASDEERSAYEILFGGRAVRWASVDEDIHVMSFMEEGECDYDNEVGRIFRALPELNVSEVARRMGIDNSLLARYIYGISRPSGERLAEIKETIREIGEGILAVV